MKKYLFVFSTLASLATVACDTSSKASTAQPLAVTPHAQVPAPVTAVDTAISPMQAKKGFKKSMTMELMQQAPITPEQAQKMKQLPADKVLPKN
jgi:hypothetical protein